MIDGKIKVYDTYEPIIVNNAGIDSDYSITFRINNKCNLACEYCHWHNGLNYSVQEIFATIDEIMKFQKIKNFKKMTFYFHGGEPSFHPRIIDILEYIRSFDNNNYYSVIEFQTNLSLSNYDKIEQYVDFFSVSYHYIELHSKKLLQKFEDNLYLLPKDKLLSLDIMMENIPEENLENFYEKTKQYIKLPFINSEMIYGFCHYKYNAETKAKHLEFYNKYNKTEQKYNIDGEIYNTNDLFKDGLDCRQMRCDAGKNTIVINGDGNVFVCGIAMTNYTNRCSSNNTFTNLLTDKMSLTKLKILSSNGYICKWNYCGGDFYLKKSISNDKK